MNSQSAKEDITKLLAGSDGYVLIFLKGGKLESSLSGNTREIFDRLFESTARQKTTCGCRDCGKCSCTQ